MVVIFLCRKTWHWLFDYFHLCYSQTEVSRVVRASASGVVLETRGEGLNAW